MLFSLFLLLLYIYIYADFESKLILYNINCDYQHVCIATIYSYLRAFTLNMMFYSQENAFEWPWDISVCLSDRFIHMNPNKHVHFIMNLVMLL